MARGDDEPAHGRVGGRLPLVLAELRPPGNTCRSAPAVVRMVPRGGVRVPPGPRGAENRYAKWPRGLRPGQPAGQGPLIVGVRTLMAGSTLTCPGCATPLSTAQPVPEGTVIRCPRCLTDFTVTEGQAATGGQESPSGSQGPSAASTTDRRPSRGERRGQRRSSPRSLRQPGKHTKASPRLVPALVGGGILLLVGIALWVMAHTGPAGGRPEDDGSRAAEPGPSAATRKEGTERPEGGPPRPPDGVPVALPCAGRWGAGGLAVRRATRLTA